MQEFSNFTNTFNKTYASINETIYRAEIFQKNSKKILDHNNLFNSGKVNWKKKIYSHVDMADKEWEQLRTGAQIDPDMKTHITDEMKIILSQKMTVPPSFSWIAKGGVTPVKNQVNRELKSLPQLNY